MLDEMELLINAPVSLAILVFTIAISLYAIHKNNALYYKWLLHPVSVAHNKEWYRMITSGFLHADHMHLLFNMLTLFFFAPILEIYFLYSVRMFIIYMISIITANISTVKKHKDNYDYRAVGASGAISAILFSFILFRPWDLINIFFIVPVPAILFAFGYLWYCRWAAQNSNDMINHDAHYWGALSGVVMTLLLRPEAIPYFINELTGGLL